MTGHVICQLGVPRNFADSGAIVDGDAIVIFMPGPSKGLHSKEQCGYHHPYKVRRPRRHKKLQSSKPMAQDPSINSRAPLPDQVQQVRNATKADKTN